MDITFEQFLLSLGLLFAGLYFVILFVWIANMEVREPVVLRVKRDEHDLSAYDKKR